MANTPNQAIYETDQGFQIDIKKVYQDYIQEIDANRSLVNISGAANQSALTGLTAKKINSLSRFLKVSDTPQESRLHCFFRIIGFPVVDSSMNNFYNPGFDNIDGPREIKLEDKLTIANAPLSEFFKFSIARENYINQINSIWSQRPATITASALALSGSINPRPFSVPTTNSNWFEFKEADQSYVPDNSGRIGINTTVSITDYLDAAGNKPAENSLFTKRSHFIKPFIVDPRIDFSCQPASRKIAVPFAQNKTQLMVSVNTFVNRPILEKVITDRFSLQSDSNASVSQKEIKEIIQTVPSITDQTLIDRVSNDFYGLDDKTQFQKYLFLITAMCKTLVDAQQTIKFAQSQYYWLPLPSTTGPEGGSDISSIIISNKLPVGGSTGFVTESDKEIIKATLNQSVAQFDAQTATVNGVPDNGGFAFDSFKLTFNTDTSDAFGNKGKTELDYLSKERDSVLTDANDALQTIEIIMGEFSGLGLCDILAIMGALYVMPKNNLLGFLDKDAYTRFVVQNSLEFADISGSLSHPSLGDAHSSFLSKVKDFYNLMDDIYKQFSKKNGQNH